MNKPDCACIDRILPRDLFRPIPSVNPLLQRARAISPRGIEWINGSTLRVYFMGGTPAQHAIVREQASWWTRYANLRFEFWGNPEAEIRVSFDEAGRNWSYIGTDARSVPREEPTMNIASLEGGMAAHQFGHAIGLRHEFQGSSNWNEEVIIRAMASAPNFWTPEQTRFRIQNRYAVGDRNGAEFDPDSIMRFCFPMDWSKDGTGSPVAEALSDQDKALIGGPRKYPGRM